MLDLLLYYSAPTMPHAHAMSTSLLAPTYSWVDSTLPYPRVFSPVTSHLVDHTAEVSHPQCP